MLTLAGEKEKFWIVTLTVPDPGLPGPVGFEPLLLLLQESEPAKAAIPTSWISFISPPAVGPLSGSKSNPARQHT
jgi:hypothetical protein